MDLKTATLWGAVGLAGLEISSFYLGIPGDSLGKALIRNSEQAGHVRPPPRPMPLPSTAPQSRCVVIDGAHYKDGVLVPRC